MTTYVHTIRLVDRNKNAVVEHVPHVGDVGYIYQYWYFYWANPYFDDNTNYERHQGDWEHVDVLLSATFQPLGVYASEHGCGSVRTWSADTSWTDSAEKAHHLNKVALRKGSSHPIIFAGMGSHANYFKGGSIRLTGSCFGAPFLARATDPYDHTWQKEGPLWPQANPPYNPMRSMVAPGEAVGDTNLTGSASHIRNDVFTDWVLYTGFWGERQVAAVHHALLPVPIGAEVQNIGPESFDSKEGIYKPGGPDGLLRKNEFERLPLQPVYAVIEKVPN